MLPVYKPELLAPVGSPEALTAAVRCGADAVYLGAGRFHARQHASPFDDAALREAIAYCHAHGVAVHMTLNTLVRDGEIAAALNDAARAATLGVDALIVQDRGLAAAIRRAAPDLVLHASTQLTCHTAAGVRELRDSGFSRVVLAREMTREEIAACCKQGVEIETFVHGALCMSVSGQCFLSAMLGGRSGNRGQCAQPCRLPFCVGAHPQEGDRALSLKDNALYPFVRDMADSGVASLKIEGRMKRPEYVAAAVSVCRAAIDGTPIDPALLEDLQNVFSRSGFTHGYYSGVRDKTMFGARTKEDVTAAPAAQKRLAQRYRKERQHVPVRFALTVREGQWLSLSAADADGHAVCATGEVPVFSDTPPADERFTQAIKKLGDTPFVAEETALCRDPHVTAPLSAVNALRREVCEQLTAARRVRDPIAFGDYEQPVLPAVPVPATPAVLVRLQTAAQYSEALADAADAVALPLFADVAVFRACAAKTVVLADIPRGCFSAEQRVMEALANVRSCGVKAALCHTADAVRLCKEAGLVPVGGFGLHTVNRDTLAVHAQNGLAGVTLSMELSPRQTAFAKGAPLPVGALVYGRLPLMLLRNCPAKARMGCRDCKQDRTLTDRKGVSFPLVCQNGCADLLNSVPLYLADRGEMFAPLSFWTLYMTTESADEAVAVTEAVKRKIPAEQVLSAGFTRGMSMKHQE